MLAVEVNEAEERWIVYDDEQTEVQVELSELIFDNLIIELIQEIHGPNDKKISV